MATLRQDIELDTDPDTAWDALRDFGALHERLVRGFVTACESDGRERVITFSTGLTVRELLVGVDDEHRRLSYAIVDGFTHYQGTAQVLPRPTGCRFVWLVDLLPDERAGDVARLMAHGATAIRRTLGGADL
ncbi:SRPBCC family protein [Actinophytocola sp.]|uniref:SRPBCC family protein n=1 Tax=Actinophytocola sp. TaxID=1872138 RepID=UPI00389A8B41